MKTRKRISSGQFLRENEKKNFSWTIIRALKWKLWPFFYQREYFDSCVVILDRWIHFSIPVSIISNCETFSKRSYEGKKSVVLNPLFIRSFMLLHRWFRHEIIKTVLTAHKLIFKITRTYPSIVVTETGWKSCTIFLFCHNFHYNKSTNRSRAHLTRNFGSHFSIIHFRRMVYDQIMHEKYATEYK